MPKPVPIPLRQKLWEQAAQGESAASLAKFYGLSPRTVRHLLKRYRDQGESALFPSYQVSSSLDHAYPDVVRQAVLASRRDHPTWGAELIRVMLADAQPAVAWPSPPTIRRWFRAAGLAHAPAGRRHGWSGERATHPHQTWQIDASEHISIADKSEVCWLRIVDEATGSVLRTDVFPPRDLDSGRSPRSSDVPEMFVPEVGPTRATASRQRSALGLARRLADRPGLLAGGTGCRGDSQSAALASRQRGCGAVAGGRQAVVRALGVWIERRVGEATGSHGPGAAGVLPVPAWPIPAGGLSWSEALGTDLRPGSGRDRLGSPEGMGIGGLASSAASSEPTRKAFGVQSAVQRWVGVGRPNCVGRIRPLGGSMDVPGRERLRDSSPNREGAEPGVDPGYGGDSSEKRSPCGKTP
jgi:Homeodomain-like domain